MGFKKKNKKNKDNREPRLITFTPLEVAETRKIAKQLLLGNAIIIDFSKTPKTTSVRIVDYVSGMLMATKGDYRKIGKNIFLISLSKELNDQYEEKINNKIKHGK